MFNQTPQRIVQTNRLPFVIGIVLLLMIMGFFMYKAQMNQRVRMAESKPHQSIDVSPKAAESSWFNEDKFKNIKINANGLLLGHLSTSAIVAQVVSRQEIELKKQEIEDVYATQLEIKKIEDKNRIVAKKLEFEAMQAPLSIEIPGPPGTQAVSKQKQSGKDGLSVGLDDILNMARSVTGAKIPTIPALVQKITANLNDQDGKQAFLKKNEADDDYLENTKKKPRSPYEVKAGSYIPAVLITGINSDLPGNVNAQVTANVYDSVTGNYLLIPQGTRLVGEFNSALSFGQQRVQVVWDRVIFPDGSSLDLERMQGVDISGYTGFFDRVNNHYLRIYGNAILLSLMGAGYDILNQHAEQNTDPRETVAAAVGQKLADVSGQTLQKNMEVQPTLVIDPGYKFKIFVMKDLVLEKIDDVAGTLAYSK